MQDSDDDSDSMWEDEKDEREDKKSTSMAPIDNAQIFFGTLEGINNLLMQMNEVIFDTSRKQTKTEIICIFP